MRNEIVEGCVGDGGREKERVWESGN